MSLTFVKDLSQRNDTQGTANVQTIRVGDERSAVEGSVIQQVCVSISPGGMAQRLCFYKQGVYAWQ